MPVGLDAGQEDIFREVIPDGSAKALSRYTDMVDALIREQNDRLAGASDDARLRLRERDLPDCLQVSPLLRACEAGRFKYKFIFCNTPLKDRYSGIAAVCPGDQTGHVHPAANALAR